MSLLNRVVFIWLYFSLASYITALPTETASSTSAAILVPRQTEASFLGWYSTGSTYSPYYCGKGKKYCQTSTFAGCVYTQDNKCNLNTACIGSKSAVALGGQKGGCGSGSTCYVYTLFPEATGSMATTAVNCEPSSPPVLFRASPTPVSTSSTAAPSDSTSDLTSSTSQVTSSTSPSSDSTSHPPPSTLDSSPSIRNSPTPTIASAQSSPTLADNNGSGLSKGAQAGIAVGAAAGGTTIIVIVVLYWRNKAFRMKVNQFFSNIIGDNNGSHQRAG